MEFYFYIVQKSRILDKVDKKKILLEGKFNILGSLIGAMATIAAAVLTIWYTRTTPPTQPYTVTGKIVDSSTKANVKNIKSIHIQGFMADYSAPIFRLNNLPRNFSAPKIQVRITDDSNLDTLIDANFKIVGQEVQVDDIPIPTYTNAYTNTKSTQTTQNDSPKNEPKRKTNEQASSRQKKPEVSTSPKGNSTPQTFFKSNKKVDIAILKNDVPISIKNIVKKYISENNISVSSSFFRPNFYSMWSKEIANNDFQIYENINAANNINCACQINSKINYRSNSLHGRSFITSIGQLEITVLNLNAEEIQSILINEQGAGSTKNQALESLAEKFEYALQTNTMLNLKECLE